MSELSMNDVLDVDPVSLIGKCKLSFINGLIKRLKVEKVRHWLKIHGLDSRGHKEVAAKRLKQFVHREYDRITNPKPTSSSVIITLPKPFRYYMVMDIEATCEEPNPVDYFHEIIELPMVIVDIETREIVSIYSVMKKLFSLQLCHFFK